jgi:hypothetical protein
MLRCRIILGCREPLRAATLPRQHDLVGDFQHDNLGAQATFPVQKLGFIRASLLLCIDRKGL